MSASNAIPLARKIWKFALRFPLAKPFLLILNSYVWMGAPEALLRAAPFQLYFKRLWLKLLTVLAMSFAFVVLGQKFNVVKCGDLNTLDSAIQIFPNVLGFGIGAYALLFTFPERFFENLESNKRIKKHRVGAQGLNAIMAFPLLAIGTIILLATILKLLKIEPWVADSIGVFFILYGMILTIELVADLFVSARKAIRNVSQLNATNSSTANITNSGATTSHIYESATEIPKEPFK